MSAMNEVSKKSRLWAAAAVLIMDENEKLNGGRSGVGEGTGKRSRVVGTSAVTTDGPPRNGPCPCGSGKKHKRCCGK